MMNQDEIKFYNMTIEHQIGWLYESPFKSGGNLIHWIKVYSALHIADTIKIGEGSITLYGKILLKHEFDEELKMPVFSVDDECNKEESNIAEWIIKNQIIYLAMHATIQFKDKLFKSMSINKNYNVIDFLRELNRGWKHIGKVHDWRNYVNSILQDEWKNLTFREKLLIFAAAEKQANNEEWD